MAALILWTKKWEYLRFVRRAVFEESEKTLRHAKTKRRRHAVLHCTHIVLIESLCFIITTLSKFLLLLESRTLVYGVVEF